MNSSGGTIAALGVVPAHERLGADAGGRCRVHDGLVVHDELVARQGVAQAGLGLQLVRGQDVHRVVEHRPGAAAGLRVAHRGGRLADEVLGDRARVRPAARPDPWRLHRDPGRRPPHGLLDREVHPLGELDGAVRPEPLARDEEPLPVAAGEGVAGAGGRRAAVRRPPRGSRSAPSVPMPSLTAWNRSSPTQSTTRSGRGLGVEDGVHAGAERLGVRQAGEPVVRRPVGEPGLLTGADVEHRVEGPGQRRESPRCRPRAPGRAGVVARAGGRTG